MTRLLFKSIIYTYKNISNGSGYRETNIRLRIAEIHKEEKRKRGTLEKYYPTLAKNNHPSDRNK